MPVKHVRAMHVYVGRAPCGCVRAITSDHGDKETGQSVAEFIAEGLTIERVAFEDYRELISQEATFLACPHDNADQLSLPLEHALDDPCAGTAEP